MNSLIKLILIALTLVSLPSNISTKKVDSVTFKVYSMVFSGKYYKSSKEIKEFFWAVPSAFNTEMNINSSIGTLNLAFKSADSAGSFLQTMRLEGDKALKSEFSEMIGFTTDFKELTFNFDALKTKISVTNVKVYQNQTSKSVEVKFMINDSKVSRSFYVTFDFMKKVQLETDIDLFIDYVNGLKGKKVQENLRNLE